MKSLLLLQLHLQGDLCDALLQLMVAHSAGIQEFDIFRSPPMFSWPNVFALCVDILEVHQNIFILTCLCH